MSPLVSEDLLEYYTIYERRRYTQVLFLKLMMHYRENREKLGQVTSLTELEQLSNVIHEQMESFRTAAVKVVTPTVEEYLTAPEDYFHIDSNFVKELDKR